MDARQRDAPGGRPNFEVRSKQKTANQPTNQSLTDNYRNENCRYGRGQEYGAHFDSLDDGSPRLATVLLYLTDVEAGGETAFPQGSAWLDAALPARLGPFSPCAAGHVAAPARRGDALLFFSHRPDGAPDPAALHAGCPVIAGVKWTATIWVHTLPFRLESFGEARPAEAGDPGACVDASALCGEWAATGECENNAPYMTGDAGALGACRLACGTCTPCAERDAACRAANRERAGYLPLDEF